ncbi:MAG: glycosyltransferase family 2 protein [Tannerella sp.]|nr:glycosyltransferase family 2 protein [Tannerella sp.]
MQIIKELAEDFFSRQLFVASLKNIKFLAVINPVVTPEVVVQLGFKVSDDGLISVDAVFTDGETVFSKGCVRLDCGAPTNDGQGIRHCEERSNPEEKERWIASCVVMPTYNKASTLKTVIDSVLQQTPNLIVVNDGSTDATAQILDNYRNRISIVEYPHNRGKGYALKCGFDKAEQLGFKDVITLDSDGQHFASEIVKFAQAAVKQPNTLFVGQRTTEGEDMPAGNSFANKFSNFWFMVQTAYKLKDTQNGFRLYPLAAMKGLRPLSSRYEAELEILVRAAWRGIKIAPIPTRVYYPPKNERITHFRPGKDFFRISVLNTMLTLIAVVYGYPSMFYNHVKINVVKLFAFTIHNVVKLFTFDKLMSKKT